MAESDGDMTDFSASDELEMPEESGAQADLDDGLDEEGTADEGEADEVEEEPVVPKGPAFLVNIDGVDFAGLSAEGRLKELTANQLKSFLYEKKHPTSGSKAVLIKRVDESLESI
jgi:hypothetical protein